MSVLAELKIDPAWDPIRRDSRSEALQVE